jgi:hypothetical protein
MKSKAIKRFIDSITVGLSDSFVVNSNKTGSGNGEAKLYIGQEDSAEIKKFYGDRGFKYNSRILKSDLFRFVNEIKPYYLDPPFQYRDSAKLSSLWHERMKSIVKLPSEEITFLLEDQIQIDPPRIYAKSNQKGFNFLRTLPLSGLAKLVIIKYRESKGIVLEFKLILDVSKEESLGTSVASTSILKQIDLGQNIDIGKEIERIRKERVGQERFRTEVIKDCNSICPFTKITDAKLLIAGHIKPWSVSDQFEKVDPKNGFVMSPTYDKLFNDGFITFTDSGKLLVSPLISISTRKKLGIDNGQRVSLPIHGKKNLKRLHYLEYHRKNVYRV